MYIYSTIPYINGISVFYFTVHLVIGTMILGKVYTLHFESCVVVT